MKHFFVIRQLRYSVINAGVPQKPPLAVVDEVAMSGKAHGDPDIGSWCPTRFVRATAIAAVDHVEPVHSGLDLRSGAVEIRTPGTAIVSAKTATEKPNVTFAFMKSSIRTMSAVLVYSLEPALGA